MGIIDILKNESCILFFNNKGMIIHILLLIKFQAFHYIYLSFVVI